MKHPLSMLLAFVVCATVVAREAPSSGAVRVAVALRLAPSYTNIKTIPTPTG